MTFTETSKSNTTWANPNNKSTSTFTEANKSNNVRLLGDVPLDEIEAATVNGMLQGRPIGEWSFNDIYDSSSTQWTNSNKSV